MTMEVGGLGERPEEERGDGHQEGEYDTDEGTVESGRPGLRRACGRGGTAVGGELTGDYLDAVLEVDPGDVEAEGIARE